MRPIYVRIFVYSCPRKKCTSYSTITTRVCMRWSPVTETPRRWTLEVSGEKWKHQWPLHQVPALGPPCHKRESGDLQREKENMKEIKTFRVKGWARAIMWVFLVLFLTPNSTYI